MKELRNIAISFLLILIVGCQSRKDDVKFIKNKELLSKIDETINLIESIGVEYNGISIQVLIDSKGEEYVKIQSEIDLNMSKIKFLEEYKGKKLFAYQASDFLTEKYFNTEYKYSAMNENPQYSGYTYENIGYVFKLNQMNRFFIEGLIGWNAPEEILNHKNLKLKFVPPIPQEEIK